MPQIDFTNMVSPTRSVLFTHLDEEIGHLFKRFEDSKIEEEGVGVNINCVPMTASIRKDVREFYEKGRNCLTKIVGKTEHIHYPFKGQYYQVDLVFYDEEAEIDGVEFFSPKSNVTKNLINRFANYCGYDIAEDGLRLMIVDANGRIHYMPVTKDVAEAEKILGLQHKSESEIMKSAETFAEWILSSERYDSAMFDTTLEEGALQFEKDVMKILEGIDVGFTISPVMIDFRLENFKLDTALEDEKFLFGKNFVKKTTKFCKNIARKPVPEAQVTGRTLIALGYQQGPIFKTIMSDVALKFSEEDNIKQVREYIKKKYPLAQYGTSKAKTQLIM